MRRLVRTWAWVWTLVLAFSLAACGGDAPAATTASSGSTAAPGGTARPVGSPAGTAGGTAATSAPASGPVKKGGTLTAGMPQDIGNLDPLLSSFVSDRQIHYNIYDSLVALDTSLNIVPALAEKWETSADGLTYTFKLRQGVKFHDGTDFDAAAVKFNIERYLTDKMSRRRTEIDTITAVDVVDANTVKFTLKSAFAPLLANLVDRAGMMLSPKAVMAGGPDFTRKPVGAGTGPFKFVEFVTTDHVTLERNASYWKKDKDGTQLPYLDKIIYRIILDETVLLTNVKTGDVQASYSVPGKDYASIKGNAELALQETGGLSWDAVQFNTAAEPFNNIYLRKAVAEALDREQINKTVFFGTRKIGYGPLPPSSFAHDANLKPYGGNVAKAKDYLKMGGKPDGFAFEFKVGSGSPTTTQLAQLMKDQLAKAGITANIVQLEAVKIATDAQMGNFQADYYGWSGRIDPDGNLYNQLRTGGSLADTKYSNPMVDMLLDKGRATSDQAQRKELYQQAQKMIVDDAPMAWYDFQSAYLLARPNVQGMQLYADYIMRFESAWVK